MKKFLSTLLIICLFSVSTVIGHSEEWGFVDVTPEHWAYEHIKQMVLNSTISGYPDGSFAPDKPVTRAEFCKMTVLASDLALGSASDIEKIFEMHNCINAQSHWSSPYIAAMLSNSYTYGDWYLSGNVNLGANVNRAEVAMGISYIVSVMPYTNAGLGEGIVSSFLSNRFSDYDKFGSHSDAIYKAVEQGFISGYPDGCFHPQNLVTRAELCAMLYRAFLADNNPYHNNLLIYKDAFSLSSPQSNGSIYVETNDKNNDSYKSAIKSKDDIPDIKDSKSSLAYEEEHAELINWGKEKVAEIEQEAQEIYDEVYEEVYNEKLSEARAMYGVGTKELSDFAAYNASRQIDALMPSIKSAAHSAAELAQKAYEAENLELLAEFLQEQVDELKSKYNVK